MSAPTEPALMSWRPQWAQYRHWALRRFLMVLPVLVVVYVPLFVGVAGAGWFVPGLLLFSLALIIAAFVYVNAMVRTSMVAVGADSVEYRSVGRVVRLPTGPGLLAVRRYLVGRLPRRMGYGGVSEAGLTLAHPAGGRWIRLNSGFWSDADLDAILAATGAEIAPKERLDALLAPTFGDRHPRLVRNLITWVSVLLLLALCVVIAVLA